MSPQQLALTEEIVPLDGLDLIEGDGSDDAKPGEAAASGPGLGVIEPLAFDLGHEELAGTEPRAAAPDRRTRATETEGDDNVEHASANLAVELADEKEPWVASVDDSGAAPARRSGASCRRGPSHTRLGGRALAVGVVVVVVGVVVAAFSSGLTQRGAPAHHAPKAPLAGQSVLLSVPYGKPAARARRPQRRHYHRRRRHHHGAHRRHRHHRHGGARRHSAPPAPAAASAPSPAPAAPSPSAARPGGGSPSGSSGGPSDESTDGSSGGSRGGGGSATGHGASSDPTFEAGF